MENARLICYESPGQYIENHSVFLYSIPHISGLQSACFERMDLAGIDSLVNGLVSREWRPYQQHSNTRYDVNGKMW